MGVVQTVQLTVSRDECTQLYVPRTALVTCVFHALELSIGGGVDTYRTKLEEPANAKYCVCLLAMASEVTDMWASIYSRS